MESGSINSQTSPEMNKPKGAEFSRAPEANSPIRPEIAPVRSEVGAETREIGVGSPASNPVATQYPAQLPAIPAAPVQNVSTSKPVSDDNPARANDDGLIEKEWVTKAKQVVQETRNDPYMQETEVSKLQADYLKKRYGKDVKLSDA